jgi:alpha-L-fucosidase
MMDRVMNRRSFMAGIAAASCQTIRAKTPPVPAYLRGYEAGYALDPHAAALRWFRDARFGMFIHYGLYSLLGKGEWIQFHDRIPVREYEKLAARFDARNFNADFLCDLALDAGMKYVTLVCKHCDSFALWSTRQGEFDSLHSAAHRDLVAEMTTACRKRNLGFFAFYEHGFDWRHPHGPAPWLFHSRSVRPAYDPPDPWYAKREEYNFQNYVDYADAQINELITNYGEVAGVWLDGIGIPLSGDKSLYRTSELYQMIRKVQPQALISYKFGLTGEEDFLAPEEQQVGKITARGSKPLEVCKCLQKRAAPPNDKYAFWGWNRYSAHKSAGEVWDDLKDAARLRANLLLNVGPLGDGSVHPEDVESLRAVGKRLRSEGFPEA